MTTVSLRFNITALLLLVLSSVATYADPLQDVQTLIQNQQYEESITLIDESLKTDKKNIDLLLAKGFALIQLQEYDKAKKHYKKVARRFRDRPEPLNNLSIVARLQGNTAESIEILQETIEKFPDYIKAYENLGDTYISMANAEYQRAAEKAADSPELQTKQLVSANFNQIVSARLNPPAAAGAEAASPVAAQPPAQSASAQSAPAPQAPSIEESIVVETPSTESDSAIGESILQSLKSWIDGWSSRDPKRYLAHYSRDFIPDGGVSQESWLNKKREILGSAEFIEINLDDIKVVRNADGTISTSFTQNYKSSAIELVSRKQLILQQYDDVWLIVREISL